MTFVLRRHRHSIPGISSVAAGTRWGQLWPENDAPLSHENDQDDDEVSIELEEILRPHHNDNVDVDVYQPPPKRGILRFTQSERNLRMDHNHRSNNNNNNNSFRNMIASNLSSSSSKIRNVAQQVMTKSAKVRLPSVITTSPRKLKQKYLEMMTGSGQDSSMPGTSYMEKSDDELAWIMEMNPENATLLQKASNHTGTTRNVTSDDDDDDDDDSSNAVNADAMYHGDDDDDAAPLLLIQADHRPTGSDSFREHVLMDCHFNIADTMTEETILVQQASPSPSHWMVNDVMMQHQQKLPVREPFESDQRSISADRECDKNKAWASQHVTPRSLRKFRTVGILQESLEEFPPKTAPIYIRATDLFPNLPTSFASMKESSAADDDDNVDAENKVAPLSSGRRTKLRRVRSVRGGRLTDSSSSLKSSSHSQKQLSVSSVTSKQHHQRVNPQEVLDRMSFGPASKHHYRSGRLSQQQSALVSNYQNLLIDIDPDNCNDRIQPDQRVESKIELVKPSNEFDLPISVQRLKQARANGESLGKSKTTLSSTIATQSKSTTPTRERVQFDFNPKNLNELCTAIAHAKIQTGSGHMTKSSLALNTKSPSAKTQNTAIIRPMIGSI